MTWSRTYQTSALKVGNLPPVLALNLVGNTETFPGSGAIVLVLERAGLAERAVWWRLFDSERWDIRRRTLCVDSAPSELENLVPRSQHEEFFVAPITPQGWLEGLGVSSNRNAVAMVVQDSIVRLAYQGLPTEAAWEEFILHVRAIASEE